jgi:hypothetical protein
VPILDVSIELPNARIVDGGDCGGALQVSSSGKFSSMFDA